MRKSSKLFILLLILSLLTSCTQEMRQTFGGMFDLGHKLAERFGEDPNIQTGGKNLTINYVNSAFNDLSSEERKIKAHEIAVFAAENYQNINEVENIAVVFTVYKNYVIFQYTNGLDAYQFTTKQLLAEKKPIQ